MSEKNSTNHDSSPTLGMSSPKTDHRLEEDAAPPPERRRRTSITPSRPPPSFDPPTAPSLGKPCRGGPRTSDTPLPPRLDSWNLFPPPTDFRLLEKKRLTSTTT
ncbi:Hypothetical predicted protein [Xyrichtys novacula]|uniref:Uncharacterized protein n=1 Tax=Xyrichtys novacula TaxID=13765 RepID=A0AAV1F3M7_XYRNO|nr:Hypothetical predicted protein [Xyrichtys novacula]